MYSHVGKINFVTPLHLCHNPRAHIYPYKGNKPGAASPIGSGGGENSRPAKPAWGVLPQSWGNGSGVIARPGFRDCRCGERSQERRVAGAGRFWLYACPGLDGFPRCDAMHGGGLSVLPFFSFFPTPSWALRSRPWPAWNGDGERWLRRKNPVVPPIRAVSGNA